MRPQKPHPAPQAVHRTKYSVVAAEAGDRVAVASVDGGADQAPHLALGGDLLEQAAQMGLGVAAGPVQKAWCD
jgi:hypothetical protein